MLFDTKISRSTIFNHTEKHNPFQHTDEELLFTFYHIKWNTKVKYRKKLKYENSMILKYLNAFKKALNLLKIYINSAKLNFNYCFYMKLT